MRFYSNSQLYNRNVLYTKVLMVSSVIVVQSGIHTEKILLQDYVNSNWKRKLAIEFYEKETYTKSLSFREVNKFHSSAFTLLKGHFQYFEDKYWPENVETCSSHADDMTINSFLLSFYLWFRWTLLLPLRW